CCGPKKKRNHGSCERGSLRLTGALLAVTLTIAGAARRAAAESGCIGPGRVARETGTAPSSGVATTWALPGTRPPRCNHSGLKGPTTNSTATATVTVWENTSQILRMTLEGNGSDGCTGRGRAISRSTAGAGTVQGLWAERFAGGGARRD